MIRLAFKLLVIIVSIPMCFEAYFAFRAALMQQGEAIDWKQQIQFFGFASVYFAILATWLFMGRKLRLSFFR